MFFRGGVLRVSGGGLVWGRCERRRTADDGRRARATALSSRAPQGRARARLASPKGTKGRVRAPWLLPLAAHGRGGGRRRRGWAGGEKTRTARLKKARGSSCPSSSPSPFCSRPPRSRPEIPPNLRANRSAGCPSSRSASLPRRLSAGRARAGPAKLSPPKIRRSESERARPTPYGEKRRTSERDRC